MLMDAFEQWTMSFERSVLFSHLLAHGDGDVPWPVAVIADATQFLAHETVRASVNDFFQFRRDGIEAVENPLRHEPARFRRKSLEAIKFIRRTFGFWSGNIFHWICRPVTITRAAQHAAAAALFQPFCVEPLLDSTEAPIFFAFVFHGIR